MTNSPWGMAAERDRAACTHPSISEVNVRAEDEPWRHSSGALFWRVRRVEVCATCGRGFGIEMKYTFVELTESINRRENTELSVARDYRELRDEAERMAKDERRFMPHTSAPSAN